MNSFRTLLATVTLFVAGGLFADEDPSIKLQSTIESALNVFYGPEADQLTATQQREKIVDLLSESYDLSVIMRRAMGRNWKKLTPDEQTEVLELFDDLVVKVTYDGLSSTPVKPEASFGKTVFQSDKRVQIPSTVVADGKTYYITYSLGRLASGWQIYDIVAEDISFVANYRQQFDDHFRRSDGAALIEKLKELVNSERMLNAETKL